MEIKKYEKILFNDKDPNLTPDSLSSIVTLRENGLSEAIIIANNEEGKSYLNTLWLYDTVTIKYAYEDIYPELVNDTGWDNIEPVFRGWIVELNPNLSIEGETVTVLARNGLGLKMMRVSKEYNIRPSGTYFIWVAQCEDSSEFTLLEGNYAFVGGGFIGNCLKLWRDSSYTFGRGYKYYGDVEGDIVFDFWIKLPNVNNYTVNDTIDLVSLYEEDKNSQIKCHIYAKYEGGSLWYIYMWGYDANGVYWSVGGTQNISSEIWHHFNLRFNKLKTDNASCILKWVIPTPPVIFCEKYNINMLSKTVKSVAVEGVFPYRPNADTSVYFDILGLANYIEGYKLRDIVLDIEKFYIEKILATNMTSGYSIGTDYVANDDNSYPYLNFPYQDVFMCIQDLIRYGSSLRFIRNPQDWRGLHWIIDTGEYINDKLVQNILIAPVGNHDVTGVNESVLIEDKWITRPLGDIPLVVKEDMIRTQFKTELPIANFVLVAGKFIHPIRNLWCRNSEYWSKVWVDVTYFNCYSDNEDLVFEIGIPPMYNSHIFAGIFIGSDFTKLITKDNNIDINLRVNGNEGGIFKLVIWCNDTFPEFDFTYHDMFKEGAWFETTLPLTTDEYETFKNPVTFDDLIDVKINGLWEAHSYKYISGIKYKDDWSVCSYPQWSNAKYLIITYTTPSGGVSGWTTILRVRDVGITGNVIRGVYTSDCGQTSIKDCDKGCIKHFGCRMYTIKDSIASTDTLASDNYNSTLFQLTLYELLRCRVPRTSGQINIPLSPMFKAGQIIRINAGYTVPEVGEPYYAIDRDFRIIEVRHECSPRIAETVLTLVDDLKSSITINTIDPYTQILSALNPDYQTRTMGSLKISGGDFTANMKPILTDTKDMGE